MDVFVVMLYAKHFRILLQKVFIVCLISGVTLFLCRFCCLVNRTVRVTKAVTDCNSMCIDNEKINKGRQYRRRSWGPWNLHWKYIYLYLAAKRTELRPKDLLVTDFSHKFIVNPRDSKRKTTTQIIMVKLIKASN